MRDNKWARPLAYMTGLVNQRLLLQCEYLIAENPVVRSHVTGRLRLSDTERSTIARSPSIGPQTSSPHVSPLDEKCGLAAGLAEVACVTKADAILACDSASRRFATADTVTVAAR